MKVYLNAKIISAYEGYNHIIELYHRIKNSSDNDIEISFLKTTWFEANLAAVLGAIIELLENEGKSISIIEVNNPNTKDILKRNGFLVDYGEESISQRQQTIISYKKFNPNADNEFINYIKNELLSKPDFPKHSILFGKKINENIFELYENARTHGRCQKIHTCGQYYPNKKRLDITIVDMGQTIKNNVNEYLKTDMSSSSAIQWALKYGNTTKTGNISGGLGLSIIMEFIKLNQGKIQIISSDGFWEYRRGETQTSLLSNYFPGTIANIEFNLDDKKSYKLKKEISLDNIF